MEGQTIYNVTKAIGRVLRQHLPQNYSDALAILMEFAEIEAPPEPTRHPIPEVETSLRPIAHFVSLYGLADFDASLDAFYANSQNIGVPVAMRSESLSSKTRIGVSNVSANGSRTQTHTFVCSWRHRSAHAA